MSPILIVYLILAIFGLVMVLLMLPTMIHGPKKGKK